MIEQITSRQNLNAAYLQVYRNKGSGGVDGKSVYDLHQILRTNQTRDKTQIKSGSYPVSPILGVEYPKGNGKTRLLGIPTVVDRVYQQALLQVLQPVFEAGFQTHSYGFRPSRNAQQGVLRSLENINAGYQHIVDIDLRSFFDEVEHYVLLELNFKEVKCKLTMKLLRSFLRAPIQINGRLHKRRKVEFVGPSLSVY